ncbi:MAG: hypothetical protein JST04_04255 [Bdellovibrionales bacterium]|nr:hypothetical protein [Bdellovibrionales bacterium]
MRFLNRRLPLLLLLALASANVSAEDYLPVDLRTGMSQQKLMCQYVVRNVKSAMEKLAGWWKYHLMGRKTPNEQMTAAFNRYPELFDSLKVTEGRRYAGPGNQVLTFNTEEDMGKVMKKTIGFCYGHATVRTYLQRLTLWDELGNFSKVPNLKRGSKSWQDFYYRRIVDMLHNEQPQIMPGFKNLEEFTADPDIAQIVRYAETQVWAERAGHLKNLAYRVDTADMKTAHSYKLVADLQHRLDSGMNPIIMFDENSNKLVDDWQNSLHVVQVVNLRKMENDRTAIIILDDKKPCGASGTDCYDVLILHHKGKDGHAYAYFDSWRWKDVNDHSKGAWDTGMGTVNQIRIVTENDHQYMRMAMNWALFCEKNPVACEELGDRAVRTAPIAKLPKAEPPYHDFAYVLGEDGQPAPVDPITFQQIEKTGMLNQVIKEQKKKK